MAIMGVFVGIAIGLSIYTLMLVKQHRETLKTLIESMNELTDVVIGIQKDRIEELKHE